MKRRMLWVLSLMVPLLLAACGPAASTTPSPTPAAGLTLSIAEPQDEAVVNSGLLRVVGTTTPDAVVSVNGTILRAIDEYGNFSAVVSLDEGPNLVEVIASDYGGAKVSRVLTVVYVPQS